MTTYTDIKAKIEANIKQIALLQQENELLKLQLIISIAENMAKMPEILNKPQQVEINKGEEETVNIAETVKIVSVKYSPNSSKTYDYVYQGSKNIKVGDKLSRANKQVIIADIKEVDKKDYNLNLASVYDLTY